MADTQQTQQFDALNKIIQAQKKRIDDLEDILGGFIPKGIKAQLTYPSSDIITSVAGSDTEVQFNDGGSFGADSDFTWDKSTRTLGLGAEDSGGTVTLKGANTGSTGDGVGITVYGGDGNLGNGNGGNVTLRGGDADSGGDTPGDIILQPGVNDGTANRMGNVRATISFDQDGGSIDVGDSYFEIFNGRDNTSIQRKATGLTTTNATPTNAFLFTAASDESYYAEVKVLARRTGGTAGSAGDSASYLIVGCFKDISGTTTQVGSTSKLVEIESQAAWDVDFNISTNTVQLQVTGAADNNITWTYEVTYFTQTTF